MQYVTDENNDRIAVMISYEKYGHMIEDILDHLVIESRKHEESYPIDEVISDLEKDDLKKYV